MRISIYGEKGGGKLAAKVLLVLTMSVSGGNDGQKYEFLVFVEMTCPLPTLYETAGWV